MHWAARCEHQLSAKLSFAGCSSIPPHRPLWCGGLSGCHLMQELPMPPTSAAGNQKGHRRRTVRLQPVSSSNSNAPTRQAAHEVERGRRLWEQARLPTAYALAMHTSTPWLLTGLCVACFWSTARVWMLLLSPDGVGPKTSGLRSAERTAVDQQKCTDFTASCRVKGWGTEAPDVHCSVQCTGGARPRM